MYVYLVWKTTVINDKKKNNRKNKYKKPMY